MKMKHRVAALDREIAELRRLLFNVCEHKYRFFSTDWEILSGHMVVGDVIPPEAIRDIYIFKCEKCGSKRGFYKTELTTQQKTALKNLGYSI